MSETGSTTTRESREGELATNDNVTIRYTDTGSGPVMVLVPGWSQTAAQWRKQIDEFSTDHRVIAIDLRGHGQSDKPEHGYRIARLAGDVHQVVVGLDLNDITLIGHSMGCSVIWSYWDQFGSDRIARLVLVDQPAVLVGDPAWAEGEAASMSAIFDYATISALNAGLKGPDAAAVTNQLVTSFFTAKADPADIAWTIELNEALPRAQAGTLLVDHAYQDWRDVLGRIDVPTLVIGGAVSIFPPAGVEWVASQIPGASVRIFSEDEGGSHCMFWENPELFNSLLRDFIS